MVWRAGRNFGFALVPCSFGGFGFAFHSCCLFDSYSCDAVTFQLFYRVAAAFVFETVAQVWDALQSRQDESGEGFEAGVARERQGVFGFQVADVD